MNAAPLALGLTLFASAVSAAEPLLLQHGACRAVLDPAQGGAIVSLKIGDRELVAVPRAARLFQLEFVPADEPQAKRSVVGSRDFKSIAVERQADGGATIRFRDAAAAALEATCRFRWQPADGLLHATIETSFPPTLRLDSVRFPIVTLRAPLGGDDDELVVGSTKGGVYRRPSRYKVGQGVLFNQPGSLAAAMACYDDQEAGLVTAMFDPEGHRKSFGATRTADGLELGWVHPRLAASPMRLEYDAVLGLYGGQGQRVDWRTGADIYKAWAVRQPWCARRLADRDDLPDWLKQGPAMVRFGRDWLAKPERIEEWLTGYWQKRFAGVPLIVAYWGWEKVATWVTPDYFPCYPSDEEFTRLVKLGRTMGAHAFLWPSGYHYTVSYDKRPDGSFAWDDRARFAATAERHAIRGRDGAPLIGERFWLRGGQNATLCPGESWTIDWFNKICDEIARRGVELVQIDQVVGAAFPVCYSHQHQHPPGPGPWTTAAMHRQVREVLAVCRRHEPAAVVGFEEPNEWLIGGVGIQDYRDLESLKGLATEPASVFGYLYHEYLPLFQSNPRRGDRWGAAYCVVSGQMPHFMPVRVTGPRPLLHNGGFEELHGSFVEGWEQVQGYQGRTFTGQATWDPGVRHGGARALRLTNTAADQVAQVSQNLRIGKELRPGATYRLSVFTRRAGLQQDNAINLAALAPGLKRRGSWQIPLPRGEGDWQRQAVDFVVPAGADVVRLMIQLVGPGTVWVDDLTLAEVGADGAATEVIQSGEPDDQEVMSQWTRLFHGAGRPYLLLGKTLHPPALKLPAVEAEGPRLPPVLAAAYEAPDRSTAAVVANATDTPQQFEICWPPNTPWRTLSLQGGEIRLLPGQ